MRHGRYPEPDLTLKSSPFVQELIARIRAIEDGKEPVESAAYWLYWRLRTECGEKDERTAADALNVSQRALAKVRSLSGQSYMRKAKRGSRPLSPSEREFLRETSRRLAIRAAEVEAVGAANVGLLTMKDFPPLPDTEAGPE